jgi:hypothetical protein
LGDSVRYQGTDGTPGFARGHLPIKTVTFPFITEDGLGIFRVLRVVVFLFRQTGKREILYRRIGRNEMSAIRVCQELAAGTGRVPRVPRPAHGPRCHVYRTLSVSGFVDLRRSPDAAADNGQLVGITVTAQRQMENAQKVP